jgi:hypothetical protein
LPPFQTPELAQWQGEIQEDLFSSNAVLVSPSGPLLRSSALKLEKHLAFVREKEEDSS